MKFIHLIIMAISVTVAFLCDLALSTVKKDKVSQMRKSRGKVK